MTILEMLEQSGFVALIGISVVFSFLILLVVCITLVSKVISALDSDKNIQAQGSTDTDNKKS